MNKMAATPTNVKTLQKSSSPEPVGQLQLIWDVAVRMQAHHSLFKLQLWVDHDLFHA